MEAIATKNKNQTIDLDRLYAIAQKFAEINKLIEQGKPIPPELSKNFVTFDIPNNPFEGFE